MAVVEGNSIPIPIIKPPATQVKQMPKFHRSGSHEDHKDTKGSSLSS